MMTKEQLDFETAMIIAEKKAQGVGPLQATALELASKDSESSYEQVVCLMRELAREGKYRPSVTINKIPILIPL